VFSHEYIFILSSINRSFFSDSIIPRRFSRLLYKNVVLKEKKAQTFRLFWYLAKLNAFTVFLYWTFLMRHAAPCRTNTKREITIHSLRQLRRLKNIFKITNFGSASSVDDLHIDICVWYNTNNNIMCHARHAFCEFILQPWHVLWTIILQQSNYKRRFITTI